MPNEVRRVAGLRVCVQSNDNRNKVRMKFKSIGREDGRRLNDSGQR